MNIIQLLLSGGSTQPILSHCSSLFWLRHTLTYQTLLFCRVPINPILGFIIRTYKKVGFGRLRHILNSIIKGTTMQTTGSDLCRASLEV